MRDNYTNIPKNLSKNNTLEEFNGYQKLKSGTDSATYAAMTGFFSLRGFDKTAGELISETIITQAKQDGYNPMQILDTLKGLSSVEISGIVAEILNFNRYKSSSLGFSPVIEINPYVARNIIP